jgi:hypothetical protein
MSSRDLHAPQAVLTYWQRQLRIMDWDLDLEVVPADVLCGAAGRCETWPGVRRDRIRVASAETMAPEKRPLHSDQEVTIVHELLHVLIPGDEDGGSSSVGQEQAVEAIAQALVRARRGEER